MKRFNKVLLLVLSTLFVVGCSIATNNSASKSEIAQTSINSSNHSIKEDSNTEVKHWKYGNSMRHA
jgi:uncharacterized protein YcfL